MTMPNINVIPSDPNLKDLLDLLKKQLKLELNCHHIGTIQSFSSTDQTAKISINYTKTFLQLDEVGNQSIETPNYPILIDCPVICLGGGGGALTFPIQPGDECLVLFNDRDFDNWFGSGSTSSPPLTGRLHYFSDAMALVGIRSIPNILTSYSTSSVSLFYKTTKLELYTDKILATLPGGITLKLSSDGKLLVTLASGITFQYGSDGKLSIINSQGEFVNLLNTLFTDIQNGLVTTMLGPEPLVMPTFAADLTKFQSFKA